MNMKRILLALSLMLSMAVTAFAADVSKPKHLTGLKPTPKSQLLHALRTRPHKIVGDTPAQFACIPPKLSMWLNDQYGNCVTAEEAFAKAGYSCPPYYTGSGAELFASDTEVYNASVGDDGLNGQNLEPVLDYMKTTGMIIGGTRYYDGPYSAVDYTDRPTLTNAISKGPVKIGVAADVLQSNVGSKNGWIVTGARQNNNEDHCVALCGYGTIKYLCGVLGVSVPAGVDGTKFGYLLFTWRTIGVIDEPSLLNICGEAWLRLPTTVVGVPTPDPTPTPTPGHHTWRGTRVAEQAAMLEATGGTAEDKAVVEDILTYAEKKLSARQQRIKALREKSLQNAP